MSDVAAAETGVRRRRPAIAIRAPRSSSTGSLPRWSSANIALAWTFKTWSDYPWTQSVTNTHKTIGITVLGLALMRLLWRIGHRPPPFSPAIPRWQVSAARTGHAALYFIILAMPLSGWIYDSAWEYAADVPIDVFGLFEMPRIAWVADMAPEPKKALDVVAGKVHVVAELPAVLPARGASHRRIQAPMVRPRADAPAHDVPRRRPEMMAIRASRVGAGLLLLGLLAPAAASAANLGAVLSYEKTAHGIAGRTAAAEFAVEV